jgi:hypothetical protein
VRRTDYYLHRLIGNTSFICFLTKSWPSLKSCSNYTQPATSALVYWKASF